MRKGVIDFCLIFLSGRCNMDLSNLLEQVEWMKLNDDKCTEMANNAFEFAMNYFTEDKLLERIHYVYQNICMNSFG